MLQGLEKQQGSFALKWLNAVLSNQPVFQEYIKRIIRKYIYHEESSVVCLTVAFKVNFTFWLSEKWGIEPNNLQVHSPNCESQYITQVGRLIPSSRSLVTIISVPLRTAWMMHGKDFVSRNKLYSQLALQGSTDTVIWTDWVGVCVGLPSVLHILCGNMTCNSDKNSCMSTFLATPWLKRSMR